MKRTLNNIRKKVAIVLTLALLGTVTGAIAFAASNEELPEVQETVEEAVEVEETEVETINEVAPELELDSVSVEIIEQIILEEETDGEAQEEQNVEGTQQEAPEEQNVEVIQQETPEEQKPEETVVEKTEEEAVVEEGDKLPEEEAAPKELTAELRPTVRVNLNGEPYTGDDFAFNLNGEVTTTVINGKLVTETEEMTQGETITVSQVVPSSAAEVDGSDIVTNQGIEYSLDLSTHTVEAVAAGEGLALSSEIVFNNNGGDGRLDPVVNFALVVKKVWNDGNNELQIRPETLEVQILDSEKVVVATTTLKASEDWTSTVINLDPNESYTVQETVPTGYTLEDVQYSEKETSAKLGTEYRTVTLINKVTPPPPPEYTSVKVVKVWKDAGYEHLRPASITVVLLADGTVVNTATLSKGNNWTFVFEGLKKGPVYTIKEVSVEGYTTVVNTISEGFFEIVNTYNPPPVEYEVIVVKKWNDQGYESVRPTSIQVQLFENGTLKETVTLNRENGWSHTFKGLKRENQYSVNEIAVNNYTSKVDVAGNVFLITNTYNPPQPPPKKITPPPQKPTPLVRRSPQTGDNFNLWTHLIIMMAAIAGILVLLPKARKHVPQKVRCFMR